MGVSRRILPAYPGLVVLGPVAFWAHVGPGAHRRKLDSEWDHRDLDYLDSNG